MEERREGREERKEERRKEGGKAREGRVREGRGGKGRRRKKATALSKEPHNNSKQLPGPWVDQIWWSLVPNYL